MYGRKEWRTSMFELRRLEKTVNKYLYFFENEQEEFRNNIDLYIDDLKELINYTDLYISSTQEELDALYKTNIDLYILTPTIVLKPLVFIIMKILEKMINKKSKNILIVKKCQRSFKKFLERLERIKYLCDL